MPFSSKYAPEGRKLDIDSDLVGVLYSNIIVLLKYWCKYLGCYLRFCTLEKASGVNFYEMNVKN